MPRAPRGAMAALVLANVLWGGGFVAAKYALADLAPPLVAFMRVAPGVPVLFAYLAWRRQPFGLTLRDAAAYGLLGFFGFAGAKYLQYAGLAKSTAVDGALLVSFEAILTMLAAVVFLREALTGRKVMSAALGFLAVCVLSRIKPWEGAAALADQRALGNAIMVLSIACEAGYTVWGARLVRRHDPLRAMAWSLLFGALLLLPPLLQGDPLSELRRAGPAAWAALLYLGLGATALSYSIWLAMAQYLDASNMAVTLYVQPLSGAVIAMLLLGERPEWNTALGGVGLLLAVHIAARGQATQRAAPPARAPAAAAVKSHSPGD